MKNVLFIFGTRPEAIKVFPVIAAMRKEGSLNVKLCSTGQHNEMLKQVLTFFDLTVDYDLMLMKPNQGLSELTASIIRETSRVIKETQADWVIVQGDTTTAMAGALAAFYENSLVAHVEAGLRSHDLYSPFPEEMNRLVISKIATLHFCPTDESANQLKAEGVNKNVHVVGNTVVDAVQTALDKIRLYDQGLFISQFSGIDFTRKIILVTCHRRESFGEPFHAICMALLELANRFPDVEIVYPVHLNPNVKLIAEKLLIHPRIKLLAPLQYHELLWLMDKSEFILTDSGGIQEEAPTLKKPVLVLRNVTERMEGVRSGTALLVGTDKDKIVDESAKLLQSKSHYQSMIASKNPYGDGQAAQRITQILNSQSTGKA